MRSSISNQNPYYVLLTGSKNNAGDYLIKYRAKKILKQYRPDRELIDLDGWKPLDDHNLELVNNSEALILLGGPSLQANMYPGIYPLVSDLDLISVPILTMGIGWKSIDGAWDKSRNYPLNTTTFDLLNRIKSSGFYSSVRDYHTLNVLQSNGYDNFVMTACPAFNDLVHVEKSILDTKKIERVSFSLGVSFLTSNQMKLQMRNMIIRVRDNFKDADFVVVFHHSIDDAFLKTHNATNEHLKGHRDFVNWLENQDIKFVDISGSAETLINFYKSVDLHIGYRVHAHIFMTSIGKRSVLICEDGRGKALRNVCDGLIFDGVDNFVSNRFEKMKKIIGKSSYYKVSDKIVDEVINGINYELLNDFPRIRKSQLLLLDNFKVMKQFVNQLP